MALISKMDNGGFPMNVHWVSFSCTSRFLSLPLLSFNVPPQSRDPSSILASDAEGSYAAARMSELNRAFEFFWVILRVSVVRCQLRIAASKVNFDGFVYRKGLWNKWSLTEVFFFNHGTRQYAPFQKIQNLFPVNHQNLHTIFKIPNWSEYLILKTEK
jgi:hypothetical protein